MSCCLWSGKPKAVPAIKAIKEGSIELVFWYSVREKRGVTQDVELDPTLMRSRKQCPVCHAES